MGALISEKYPKVSVVIPVFGVEKYIECCARSLFEQSLDDIEYLFVDDCGIDNSIAILKEVAKEYPNRAKQIRIIRMDKNSGQAAARKRGIKEATGDFIIHCDSDDWVDINMYERMYSVAIAEKADIVKCRFRKVYNDREKVSDKLRKNDYDSINSLLSCLFIGKDLSSLCDKLVARSLYDKIEDYPEDNMWEDVYLCTQLIFYSEKFVNLDDIFYNYRIQESSIVHSQDFESAKKRLYQSYNNVCRVEIFVKEHAEKCDLMLELDCLKKRVKNQMLPYLKLREAYNIWFNTFKEINWRILFNKKYSYKGRMLYVISLMGLYPFFIRKQ